MSVILDLFPKIVKNFNTIEYLEGIGIPLTYPPRSPMEPFDCCVTRLLRSGESRKIRQILTIGVAKSALKST
jgi:hypothetical protein